MYAAMLTVANHAGRRHDVWAVNTDFEYHEADRLRHSPITGTRPHPAEPRPAAGRRPAPAQTVTPI